MFRAHRYNVTDLLTDPTCASAVVDYVEHTGFAIVKGVDFQKVAALYGQARTIFSSSKKEDYEQPTVDWGYRTRGQGTRFQEIFEINAVFVQDWPTDQDFPQFKPVASSLWHDLMEIARVISQAYNSQVDEAYLGVQRYPKPNKHSDHLLPIATARGLEILTVQDIWHEEILEEDELVYIPGRQRAKNCSRIQATRHRVLSAPRGCVLEDRFSITFGFS